MLKRIKSIFAKPKGGDQAESMVPLNALVNMLRAKGVIARVSILWLRDGSPVLFVESDTARRPGEIYEIEQTLKSRQDCMGVSRVYWCFTSLAVLSGVQEKS